MRWIDVEIDKNTWGKNIPSPGIAKINNHKFEFLFIDLMEGIALATKYPYLRGMSLNDQWAWMRYKTCFIPNSDLLQLTRDYKMVDSHQKTILSDDLGTGVAYTFLNEKVGIKSWVDTNFILEHSHTLSPKSKAKNGQFKSPDFLVLDKNNRFYLIECKGTQTGKTSQNKQLKSGIVQKNNIHDSKGYIVDKMVFSTLVQSEEKAENTSLKIVDPPKEFLPDISKESLILLMYKYQLFKEISFVWRDAYSDERFDCFYEFKNYILTNIDKDNEYENTKEGFEVRFDFQTLESMLIKSNSFEELIEKYGFKLEGLNAKKEYNDINKSYLFEEAIEYFQAKAHNENQLLEYPEFMNYIDGNYYTKYSDYFTGLNKQEIYNFLMLAAGLEKNEKEESSQKVSSIFGLEFIWSQ